MNLSIAEQDTLTELDQPITFLISNVDYQVNQEVKAVYYSDIFVTPATQ